MRMVMTGFWTTCVVLATGASPVFAQLFDGPFGYFSTRGSKVCAADLNGDARADLAVAHAVGVTGVISVLLNNGDGTFPTAVGYAFGAGVTFAVDLDDDSDLDLAVAGDNLLILLNDGDGTLQFGGTYPVGIGPSCVVAADLDGDTDPDLAVTDGLWDDVTIFLNNGDGTFQAGVHYQVYGGSYGPTSVCAADLDGDTDRDLAVTNSNSHTVTIFLNNGDGTFVAVANLALANFPVSVIAEDLDGDSDFDLAAAFAGGVAIFENNGNGTFQAAVTYATSGSPLCITAADFDGDEICDLAAANSSSHDVSILLGIGDGTFQAADNYAAGGAASWVAAADLDGDWDQDLAIANNNHLAAVLLNRTANTFPGMEIVVSLEDTSGTSASATLTFDEVTTGGVTSFTSTDTVPPIPPGFDAGDPPTYYDIRSNAKFHMVEVCIHYDVATLGVPEPDLRLLHYDVGVSEWGDVTTGQDMSDHTICGVTDRLSPFALATVVATGVGEPDPAGRIRFGHARPNPTHGPVAFTLEVPRAIPVTIRVLDLAGRVVRTLSAGRTWGPGTHEVAWDGRDAYGRSAPSGLYFLSARAAGENTMRRIVRLE